MSTPSAAMPAAPGRSFASDNAAGAHPAVLAAISDANAGHALAYGDDDHTRICEQRFRELFDADVSTMLTFNGTGANIAALGTMLGALTGPHHAIVCTNWSHIEADETGAPERILSTKLIDLPSHDAKITPEMIDSVAHLQGVVHHAQPGIVSITQPTELGTLYSAEEVAAVCDAAHRNDMLVHLDGARIANATAALGGTVDALRSFTVDAGVDAVSFGGTKNGALGAEAVVFTNPELASGSRFVRKQVTQLPSKMRFLAAQFNALLDGDLWIELGAHSNRMATQLFDLVANIDGVDAGGPPDVNSMFPKLSPAAIARLRKWCFFWDWDATVNQVRWMTAWDTTEHDINQFAEGVRIAVST